MCLHATWMPPQHCSRCTPVKPQLHATPTDTRAWPTDIILHDADTSKRFDAMVAPLPDGCLVFQQEADSSRGFRVSTSLGPKTISPARYALSRAGRRATSDEIVKCSCGRVGDQHGNGVCVNPHHLITVR